MAAGTQDKPLLNIVKSTSSSLIKEADRTLICLEP